MPPFQSVCLDDFPSPGDPRAPADTHRRAAFYGSIACAATAWPFAGTLWRTALPCRRRPHGQACTGRLVVVRSEVPPEIRWSCPACGDGGVIRAFEHSPWDLGVVEIPADRDPARLDVPLAPLDLAVLRAIDRLERPERRTVMTALDRGSEVVLWGPPEALWRLLEAVRAEARLAGRRRRLALERVAAAIEAALLRVA
ncbi:MAG: hypothetical protein JXB39_08470 [Deltaproteobacteria bacterium]|nr:hypothetical protein [Deltaproteobacteria bacterium]